MCRDEKYNGKSFGVVSLQGKTQQELIDQELLEKLVEKDIEAHRIKCGSFEHFQGNARDATLLSTVIANNENCRPLSGKLYEQRYNVATSSAKEQTILFHSVKPDDLSETTLRKKLLEFFERKYENEVNRYSLTELEDMVNNQEAQNNATRPSKTKFESWLELDVAVEIMKREYRIIPQYEVTGRRIDIVVEEGSCKQLNATVINGTELRSMTRILNAKDS